MKIQLINPSKLKITFNKEDLDENSISIHGFLAGNQTSLNFLKAIIEIAHEDFGFSIENNDFLYEIFCFDFSEFVIIVSPNINNSEFSYIIPNINYVDEKKSFRDVIDSKILSFNFVDNKLSNLKNKNIFLFFSAFEDFLEFSDYIKNCVKSFKVNSFLYKYNNTFLLEISTSNLSQNELKRVLSIILESNANSYFSELVIIRFKEFADLLISDNAMNL